MAINVGVTGAIITGGLGRPACKGIITVLPFSLICEFVLPPPKPKQGGGSIPLAPGEIQGFYQPVDGVGTTPSEGKFVDPSVYGKKLVRVTIRFQDHVVEKEFMVTEKRAKHVVKIINLMNATRAKMSVMASNIHSIATRAVVTVKNLRIKYFGNK